MHYYVEITCLPDEGVSTAFIMGKVMDVLHLALVNLQQRLGRNPVGISFPEYGGAAQMGGKIRLFSQDQAHLESLNLPQQLQRLADYVHLRVSAVSSALRWRLRRFSGCSRNPLGSA